MKVDYKRLKYHKMNSNSNLSLWNGYKIKQTDW